MNPSPPPPAAEAEIVSELLPPTMSPPPLPRQVGFVRAIAFHWLLPRRYGPDLAAGSLRRAVAAHAIAMFIATASIGLTLVSNAGPIVRSLHQAREVLAEFILDLAAQLASGSINALDLLTFVAIPAIELAIPILAVLALPWCADGDSIRSAARRSLNNAYWASTIVIPVAIAVSCIIWRAAQQAPRPPSSPFFPSQLAWPSLRDESKFALAATFTVAYLLFLRALLCGADRYVGPPVGPAFVPREPRCEGCGYRLFGLPLDSKCPECGLIIRSSLPEHHRPTAWERDHLRAGGIVTLIHTHGRVLRGSGFFNHMRVQQSTALARHFWWTTYLLWISPTLALALSFFWVMSASPFDPITAAFSLFILAPLILQSPLMLAACVYARFRFGIHDLRVPTNVALYSAPLLWPCAAIMPPAMWLRYQWTGISLTYFLDPIPAAILLALIAWPIFVWLRISRALRAVRFANA